MVKAKPFTDVAIREVADTYAVAERVPSSEVIKELAKSSEMSEQKIRDIFDEIWQRNGHEGSLFDPLPGPILG